MKKKAYLIIMIVTILSVLTIGTFALITWRSEDNTEISVKIGDLAEVYYYTSQDINISDIGPIFDYETDAVMSSFSVAKVTDTELNVNVKLNVSSITSNLNEETFKYVLTSSTDNTTYTKVTEGNFLEVTSGDTLTLVSDYSLENALYFKLYIFIDGNYENPISMQGGSLSGSILVEASGLNSDASGANSPDLVEGLIPIVYESTTDSEGNVTTKILKANSSNNNNSWYNYSNKEWANAVLVSSTNRSTYQSAAVGTEIPMDDILAFYVWIPRYKYKVWNISKQAGEESTYAYNAYSEGIDIVFENEKKSTGTIECSYNFNVDPDNGGIDLSTTTAETCIGSNGDYYTHPAFCLGEITDGECSGDTLRGFWIGKFELSSSKPQTGDSFGGGISTSLTPRVLPNVTSWRNNYLSAFNNVIQKMTKNDNIYGLDASTTSSHILTNMGWGAVAYLTNSKYGRCTNGTCTEVELNAYGEDSYYTTMTGCGPISAGEKNYETTCNAYDTTLGMSASTTGNIYGVYDMSGGAAEYVMGNISSVTTKYTFYPSSSNFISSWDTSNDNSKFLTKYAYNATSGYKSQKAYNPGRLGDATSEIVLNAGNATSGSYTTSGVAWYSDYATFPYSSLVWFSRGGNLIDATSAGVFSFGGGEGIENADYVVGGIVFTGNSTRSALSLLEQTS